VKIELDGKEGLWMMFGVPAFTASLVLISMWVGSRAPIIQIDGRVTVDPKIEASIPPIKVDVAIPAQAPAQIEIRQVPVDRVQVPDVKIQNTVQPADVVLKPPAGPIDVNVVNLPGFGSPPSLKPNPEPADPEGKLLPPPKGK
jgi:hypothetical protein